MHIASNNIESIIICSYCDYMIKYKNKKNSSQYAGKKNDKDNVAKVSKDLAGRK